MSKFKVNVTPEEACSDPSFCLELVNGSPRLKRNHEYYDQIQGQMALTGQSGVISLFIHPEDSVLNAFHLIKNAGAMFVLYYIKPIFVTFYLQQPKKVWLTSTIINRFHFSQHLSQSLSPYSNENQISCTVSMHNQVMSPRTQCCC